MRSKPFVRSPNFAPLAFAWHTFGCNPCDELGIQHSVDRAAFLLACGLAVQREQERTRVQELQLLAEITAQRFYAYLCRFWDGSEVPPLSDLTAKNSAASVTTGTYERDGRRYQMIDGTEFEIV